MDLSSSSEITQLLYRHGYVVEKTIGSGAYAKVKLAHCARNSTKKVAIKVVDKKKAPGDVIKRFLPRELEAMRTLRHQPRIIQLVDVLTTEGEICIVMELAEKGDLLDYINAHQRLSETCAKRMFRDLIEGISNCHRWGIVHRDLKCENLLIDKDNHLKIADFGFARTYEGRELETYCGSFAYAAPEIILGQPYNGVMTDIWSMGVILYAMVCGRLPFRDTNVKTLMSQISSGIHFPEGISDSCKDLIRKILVFSSRERITTWKMSEHPWVKVVAAATTATPPDGATQEPQQQAATPLSLPPPPPPPPSPSSTPPPPSQTQPPEQ